MRYLHTKWWQFSVKNIKKDHVYRRLRLFFAASACSAVTTHRIPFWDRLEKLLFRLHMYGTVTMSLKLSTWPGDWRIREIFYNHQFLIIPIFMLRNTVDSINPRMVLRTEVTSGGIVQLVVQIVVVGQLSSAVLTPTSVRRLTYIKQGVKNQMCQNKNVK